MPCEIHERADYVEVRVPAGTTKLEMLATVVELNRRDKSKRMCDLWLFSSGVELSYAEFAESAEAIRRLCGPGMKGNRCAIVGGDAFQQAQLEFYRAEAAHLPFEIRIFGEESAAIRWLRREGEKPLATPR